MSRRARRSSKRLRRNSITCIRWLTASRLAIKSSPSGPSPSNAFLPSTITITITTSSYYSIHLMSLPHSTAHQQYDIVHPSNIISGGTYGASLRSSCTTATCHRSLSQTSPRRARSPSHSSRCITKKVSTSHRFIQSAVDSSIIQPLHFARLPANSIPPATAVSQASPSSEGVSGLSSASALFLSSIQMGHLSSTKDSGSIHRAPILLHQIRCAGGALRRVTLRADVLVVPSRVSRVAR